MRVALWSACFLVVLGTLLATALRAEGETALQYRWCWCVKLDERHVCRGHVVSRTCWEVPLCREPQPVGKEELECWRRQRGQIGKDIKQSELSGDPG